MKSRTWFVTAGVTAAILAAPLAAAQEESPLIERNVIFGNPDRAGVQLSPDGTRISWLAAKDGVLNVWVAPIDDLDEATCVTNDTYRGIRIYNWAFNNTHIVFLQDKGGDENFLAYSVNVNTGQEQALTPFEESRVMIQQRSWKFPNEYLVGINNRDQRYFDIHRVNVVTGDLTLVKENTEGYGGFVTDEDFNVRLAQQPQPGGETKWFVIEPDGSAKQWQEVPFEDGLSTGWGGFDKTGRIAYGIDSRPGNTAALTATNLDTGKTEILAANDLADAGGSVSHPTENVIQAVSFTYERLQWKVLDDAIADDFAYLRTVADGDFSISSRSLDDTLWTVAYVMDDGPVRYYLYDNRTNKARFLFTNRKALEGVQLSKMHPVVIESRDGKNLVSYYTLPSWTDTDGDGTPSQALPTVLLVHGGPWARDRWGYNSMHQWLANRGYAVLSVNYRGSTGFGKEFVNASSYEWAGKMHDDLIDAVRWAVREGIAAEDRIAIMGGSYGGYATLVGMTFTPEEFVCGVDIVGPSNLNTLLNSIPPYWAPFREQFKKRVGDFSTPEGQALLEERSPLTRADQIVRPLLIGQGANDPRVKQQESDQIVEAMRKKGIPVTYVLFPDEGHGFARPENRLAFNAVAEGFLQQHLGGRYQPIDDDFDGSTIQVPEGADQLPGLAESLSNQ